MFTKKELEFARKHPMTTKDLDNPKIISGGYNLAAKILTHKSNN